MFNLMVFAADFCLVLRDTSLNFQMEIRLLITKSPFKAFLEQKVIISHHLLLSFCQFFV